MPTRNSLAFPFIKSPNRLATPVNHFLIVCGSFHRVLFSHWMPVCDSGFSRYRGHCEVFSHGTTSLVLKNDFVVHLCRNQRAAATMLVQFILFRRGTYIMIAVYVSTAENRLSCNNENLSCSVCRTTANMVHTGQSQPSLLVTLVKNRLWPVWRGQLSALFSLNEKQENARLEIQRNTPYSQGQTKRTRSTEGNTVSSELQSFEG